MRIEIAKADFQYIDANNQAHYKYKLQFWDENNDPIEDQEVRGFVEDAESETMKKIADTNTNIDGVIEVQVVFDLAKETQKSVQFVIGFEKREAILSVDMTREEIRKKIDAIYTQKKRQKLELVAQENADRLKRCKELGNFQEKIGIGRILTKGAWVLINNDGAVISEPFAEIKPFDEQTKQAHAKVNLGDLTVIINERGQIIDEATGLHEGTPNVNERQFKIPVTLQDYIEAISVPSWIPDYREYAARCYRFNYESQSQAEKNRLMIYGIGFDPFGWKKSKKEKERDSLEESRIAKERRQRNQLNEFYKKNKLPTVKTALCKTQKDQAGNYGQVFSSNPSWGYSSYSYNQPPVDLIETGYLSGCPIVTDLNSEDEANLQKYLREQFQAKAEHLLVGMCRDGVTIPDGSGDFIMNFRKKAAHIDLAELRAFISSHTRFRVHIFLDGKLYTSLAEKKVEQLGKPVQLLAGAALLGQFPFKGDSYEPIDLGLGRFGSIIEKRIKKEKPVSPKNEIIFNNEEAARTHKIQIDLQDDTGQQKNISVITVSGANKVKLD